MTHTILAGQAQSWNQRSCNGDHRCRAKLTSLQNGAAATGSLLQTMIHEVQVKAVQHGLKPAVCKCFKQFVNIRVILKLCIVAAIRHLQWKLQEIDLSLEAELVGAGPQCQVAACSCALQPGPQHAAVHIVPAVCLPDSLPSSKQGASQCRQACKV